MNWIDVGFAVVGVAVSMYIVVFYHDLVLRAGMNNETDYIIALIGTLLVIEGARRVVGWPMITIAICLCCTVCSGACCRVLSLTAALACMNL